MEAGNQRPGISVGRTSGAWIHWWLHLLCLLLPQFSAQIPITLLQPRCSSREEAVAACVRAQQDCFLRVGDMGGTQPWEMRCTWSTHANCILLALFLCQLGPLTFHVCLPRSPFSQILFIHTFVLHVASHRIWKQYLSCPILPGEMVQPVKARLTRKTLHLTLSELSVAFTVNLTHPDHPLVFRRVCAFIMTCLNSFPFSDRSKATTQIHTEHTSLSNPFGHHVFQHQEASVHIIPVFQNIQWYWQNPNSLTQH